MCLPPLRHCDCFTLAHAIYGGRNCIEVEDRRDHAMPWSMMMMTSTQFSTWALVRFLRVSREIRLEKKTATQSVDNGRRFKFSPEPPKASPPLLEGRARLHPPRGCMRWNTTILGGLRDDCFTQDGGDNNIAATATTGNEPHPRDEWTQTP